MKKDFIAVCMNPVRQRILQVIIARGEANVAQIGEVLSDVSRASLYRHIKVLLDAEVIQVTREEAKRGTVEKTYAMAVPKAGNGTGKDMEMLVHFALLSINSDFATYFQKEDCNPQRDMLTLGSATLMLDDEEFSQFIQEYGTLVQKHMENKPNEKRKARKITFISSPNLE